MITCTYPNLEKSQFEFYYNLATSFGLKMIDFTIDNDSEMTIAFRGDGTRIHNFGESLASSV